MTKIDSKGFRLFVINNSKGFTLVELLIVIAIIGIISGIVLASLNSARQKAFDVKVKAQLSNIRNAAEIYRITNGDYGASTVSCASGMFADTASGLQRLSISANYPAGENTIICESNGNDYAVQDNFLAANSYWCVDSKGTSKQTSSSISTTSPTYACP